MNKTYHLHAALSENAAAQSHDVLATKAILQQHGHYEAPDWGVSAYPDRALFEAIRAFQKSQGLRVDGVMKPEGETEAAMQAASAANQTDARRIQSLGRNGDTLLAHITPEEAQLLDTITDGGSINPATGLMEFHHIGGNNYTRERDARERNQQGSSDRAASGNQRSGDRDSDRGRTLGYNDFNPGGAFGGNNRDGTNKTGKALSVHNRAVIKQNALQREKERQAALKAKNAAEAQRQQVEAERARAAAAAVASQNTTVTTTAMQVTPSNPPSTYDLNANPDHLTAPTNQDAPEQAPRPTPTPTPTTPETTEGVDPAWSPSATPVQQATNIKKTQKFTEKQLEIARKANETKERGRQQVNDYLAEMKQRKAKDQQAANVGEQPTQPSSAAELRKTVWTQTKKKISDAKEAQIQKAAEITKSNAARLGVPVLSDQAALDPLAQAAIASALSFRFQNSVQRAQTLESIVELSKQYPEFGMTGIYGDLAVSISDRTKTPSQMTDDELRASIEDAKHVVSTLEFFTSLPKVPAIASISINATTGFFIKAIDNMENELLHR